ncbi:MAG: protein kinase [Acidobacteria bacterium]|nr:protein kinase [Acidobacteriota bacterium]MBI3425211.1 protein kinase [Acidobacteriota bacterium]
MKYCPQCQRHYAISHSVCQNDGAALLIKDLYGLTGRIINDKYRIESMLTIGGMSAVYRARQIGVERQVAFKILLPNLAVNDQNMLVLFEREARTAGRLTHENIATVHDAGRTPDELAYIVMEWLEGKTLEEEFNNGGQMSYRRMLHLLRQIAAALDTAHAQGVIHRDLKPANIMILPRGARGDEDRDLVKVLDFGLAKVTSESTDLQVSSALGTPHYASPEQFRIGEEIDGRSDIYSLGVILYRMLTGFLPFEATSVHALIRLHLLETPPPLRNRRADVPSEVEYLVNRMLAKTPHYRPGTAGEAIEALEQSLREHFSSGELFANGSSGNHKNSFATSTLSGNYTTRSLTAFSNFSEPQSGKYGTPSGPQTAPLGVLNSGNHTVETNGATANLASGNQASSGQVKSTGTLPATLAGATFVSVNAANGSNASSVTSNTTTNLAVPAGFLSSRFAAQAVKAAKDPKKVALVLVCAVAIGLALFSLIRRGRAPLTGKDTILLGDINNTTGEEVFDKTLKPALTVQLAQSPFLNLLGEDKVRETLGFMSRPPDTRLTRDIAREIALRRGLKATLIGQLDKLDQSYSLRLELVNSQTGETLTRALAEAPGKDNVLKALGQAALKLREELGESLNTVKKFNAPIEQATTASLDALKAYTLGGEQLYQNANPFEAIPFYQRAIELDPNFAMPYHALGALYGETGQARLSAENATKAYNLRERVSERERLTITALYHSVVTGDANKALETYRLMAQTYPNDAQAHIGQAKLLLLLGQPQQALDEAETALRLAPAEVNAHNLQASALLRLNRFDEAKQKIEQARAQKLDGVGLRTALFQLAFLQGNGDLLKQQIDWAREHQLEDKALDWQAQVAAANGGIKQAAAEWRKAIDLNQQRGREELSAGYALAAGIRLALSDQPTAALKLLDEAETLAPDGFLSHALNTNLPFGPFTYALAAKPEKAQALADELSHKRPQNLLFNNAWLPLTRALRAVQANQAEQALEMLRPAAAYENGTQHYFNWVRGLALLNLKRGPEAAAEFQKILSQRGADPVSLLYPLAHLAMARAQAVANDRARARIYYKDFFTLWKGADADLPVLAEAKKEFAALK